jgi:hypothetical protein
MKAAPWLAGASRALRGPSALRVGIWAGDLSAQDIYLLAQGQEFEILGTRGTTSRRSKRSTWRRHIATRRKTMGHSRQMVGEVQSEEDSQVGGEIVLWHPSGAISSGRRSQTRIGGAEALPNPPTATTITTA